MNPYKYRELYISTLFHPVPHFGSVTSYHQMVDSSFVPPPVRRRRVEFQDVGEWVAVEATPKKKPRARRKARPQQQPWEDAPDGGVDGGDHPDAGAPGGDGDDGDGGDAGSNSSSSGSSSSSSSSTTSSSSGNSDGGAGGDGGALSPRNCSLTLQSPRWLPSSSCSCLAWGPCHSTTSTPTFLSTTARPRSRSWASTF